MDIGTLNELIQEVDTNEISDGYHTFGELYTHRIALYIALCSALAYAGNNHVWCTKVHSDGSVWDGWFLLGLNKDKGEQITYHLPNEYWDRCIEFAEELDIAPDFDGHTSDDVLNRLINI